ncbi:hypothetical protein LFYK43_06750 [Ligilactobacillus salitolerans]|uniref:Uncharacterized protein n=1 Tax=Ligilactobacillus salitolerans TaxID=1808352 RepID=A0A401IRS0_9LACO|nr:hypothetical protein [Ligilactobacillus salitolerans]GBG94216.1 hypothetical protein LFYK43_06750 [Ligilactobacillus salitolerans]
MADKYTKKDLLDLKSQTMREYAAQFEKHYAAGLAKILNISAIHAVLAQDFEDRILADLKEMHGDKRVMIQTNGHVAPYTLIIYLGDDPLEAFSKGRYAFAQSAGLENIITQLVDRDPDRSAQEKGMLEDNLLLGLCTTFLLTSVYMIEDPIISKYLTQPEPPKVENNILEYSANGRNIVNIPTMHQLDEKEQQTLSVILKLRPEIDQTTVDVQADRARYSVFDF